MEVYILNVSLIFSYTTSRCKSSIIIPDERSHYSNVNAHRFTLIIFFASKKTKGTRKNPVTPEVRNIRNALPNVRMYEN